MIHLLPFLSLHCLSWSWLGWGWWEKGWYFEEGAILAKREKCQQDGDHEAKMGWATRLPSLGEAEGELLGVVAARLASELLSWSQRCPV